MLINPKIQISICLSSIKRVSFTLQLLFGGYEVLLALLVDLAENQNGHSLKHLAKLP